MRHHTSSCLLLALSSLFLSSSGLPFVAHPKVLEPFLQPRASYSVVPVDGGAPTGTAGEQFTTATVTQTVISTVAPVPITTLTVISTLAPEPPATLTVTSTYSVAPDTETLTIISTVIGQGMVQTSVVTIMPDPVTITITAVPSPTSSTKTFDDGMWHTTYPPWSNSSTTATITPVPEARLV